MGSEMLLGLTLGVGLAAACGFRVFVPLLVMNLAAQSGHLTLAPDFAWVSSSLATWVLIAATVLEVGAYYIPFLDNLLDTAATPAAVIAGTVVTAAAVGDVSPVMKWSLGLIAGGGAAGTVQVASVQARLVSSATTAGMGNPVVSTAENGGAVALSVAAIALPMLALFAAALVATWLLLRARRAPTAAAA